MARNPRILFAAAAVAAAAAAGVALAVATGGSDDEEPGGATAARVVRAQLALERFRRPDTGEFELLVSLTQPRLNTLDVTGGAQAVLLRCVDLAGAEAVAQQIQWPLLEEAGYPPHAHQPLDRRVVGRIRSCRMTGPGIDFRGRVPGPPPVSE